MNTYLVEISFMKSANSGVFACDIPAQDKPTAIAEGIKWARANGYHAPIKKTTARKITWGTENV